MSKEVTNETDDHDPILVTMHNRSENEWAGVEVRQITGGTAQRVSHVRHTRVLEGGVWYEWFEPTLEYCCCPFRGRHVHWINTVFQGVHAQIYWIRSATIQPHYLQKSCLSVVPPPQPDQLAASLALVSGSP